MKLNTLPICFQDSIQMQSASPNSIRLPYKPASCNPRAPCQKPTLNPMWQEKLKGRNTSGLVPAPQTAKTRRTAPETPPSWHGPAKTSNCPLFSLNPKSINYMCHVGHKLMRQGEDTWLSAPLTALLLRRCTNCRRDQRGEVKSHM